MITTALIPGRPAPVLITADMVASMKPGSVIVDLAIDNGGNCALSKGGEASTTDNGVTIVAYHNLPSRLAAASSSLYARNVETFVELIFDKEAKDLAIDWEDEIIQGTLVTKDGAVVHPALAPKDPAPEDTTTKEGEA